MTNLAMARPTPNLGVLSVLRRVLYRMLLAVGLGQDGPAGQLHEDMLSRNA